MRITAVSGGVGGARFLRGLLLHLSRTSGTGLQPGATADGAAPDDVEVTVIANTGDDITLHGLRVCPDLDTLMYTLGDGVDEDRGWGRDGDTDVVSAELAAYGAEPTWFTLGDRDIATHLVRTRMLGAGYPLSAVTEALCRRWQPGVRLLPMSDQPVETHVLVDDPGGHPGTDTDADTHTAATGRRAVHLQEWWVRMRAGVPARGFPLLGLDRARPGPGVLEAVRDADVVLLPPSNPVVSVGPVLAMPGVRDALRGTRAPVVGVSPVIGGQPVRGMAAQCMAALGVPCTAAGVASLYADLLDGWLVDTVDAPAPGAPAPRAPGARESGGAVVEGHPLLMSDAEEAARIAGAALELALRLRAR